MQTMKSYRSIFRKVSELSGDEFVAMIELYLRYYDGSSEEIVRRDLNNKTEVLLIYFNDELVGFTAYQIYQKRWCAQTIQIVFSGDTIVDRKHWGQQSLAFNWISRMGELKRAQPEVPLYWFLLVKGHRTYRYLPAFTKSFYPHWSSRNLELEQLAAELAKEKYGVDYNTKTGVIEFENSKGHLKKAVAEPTACERGKQAVKYFLDRNPNYQLGHELVCLYKFDETNMKPLTRRIFSQGIS